MYEEGEKYHQLCWSTSLSREVSTTLPLPGTCLPLGCLGLAGILIQKVSGSFGPTLGELDAGGKNLEKIPLSDAMYYVKHLKLPQTK